MHNRSMRVDSWRDSEGHEVDAVVSVGPDKWGAFEVKLSPDAVDEAASSRSEASDRDGANPVKGPWHCACSGLVRPPLL